MEAVVICEKNGVFRGIDTHDRRPVRFSLPAYQHRALCQLLRTTPGEVFAQFRLEHIV